MHLIDELEALLNKEESMFRAQLLREDVVRLRKLADLARENGDREAYVKAGMYIGWTSGDIHTHELKDELEPLLDAMYAYATGGGTDEQDQALRTSWDAFHIARMRKIVHCL